MRSCQRELQTYLRVGSFACLMIGLILTPGELAAQKEGVRHTLHNLSVSGPGEVRSLTETQVCKFCHIPHSAVVPSPLWGHELSKAVYRVPSIRQGRKTRTEAPQPDGSSRLCLSCHDGTVALGDVVSEAKPIPMMGATYLHEGRPGFLGTDLSGSHPVSFAIAAQGEADITSDLDMAVRPLAAIVSDPDVKLDKDGKMQCTSCHDPHSDRYFQPGKVPHFWVKPTFDEVCLTCHDLQ